MRGEPQRGLLRLITRIRSRISCGTLGRPALPRPIFYVQNKRKPLRCQATTVSALTIIRADFQSLHTRRNQTQKNRSAGGSFNRFGVDRRKTASCCRPSDSIQSLEVISGAPPAEFGDKTSVVIKVTTRSGLGVTKPTGRVYTSYGSFGTANAG